MVWAYAIYLGLCGREYSSCENARTLSRGETGVNVAVYSGSEAKAHPFTGGMKPTTGYLSTLVTTAGVGCLRNIFRWIVSIY
jgi:hypothetical protein